MLTCSLWHSRISIPQPARHAYYVHVTRAREAYPSPLLTPLPLVRQLCLSAP